MKTPLAAAFAVVLLIGVVMAGPVKAQDWPNVSVAGGYAVAHSDDGAGTFPLGWFGAVDATVNNWFSIEGQASGAYQTVSLGSFPARPTEFHESDYAFLGGPRFSVRTVPVDVFGQVLWGATNTGNSSAFGNNRVNHLVWQPGVGIDVNLSRRMAVRFEADYRLLPSGVVAPHVAQFVTGIVLRSLGKENTTKPGA
jgi:hypothetical protein